MVWPIGCGLGARPPMLAARCLQKPMSLTSNSMSHAVRCTARCQGTRPHTRTKGYKIQSSLVTYFATDGEAMRPLCGLTISMGFLIRGVSTRGSSGAFTGDMGASPCVAVGENTDAV